MRQSDRPGPEGFQCFRSQFSASKFLYLISNNRPPGQRYLRDFNVLRLSCQLVPSACTALAAAPQKHA